MYNSVCASPNTASLPYRLSLSCRHLPKHPGPVAKRMADDVSVAPLIILPVEEDVVSQGIRLQPSLLRHVG